ncbi:MAG: hypothetical protein RL648_93 [Verrucomicrobiota bacterium]
MHRIRLPYRSLLWLPLALLFVVPSKATPTITPAAAGFDGERLQRLTSALEAAVSEERMAGAVALVLKDGEVLYEQSVGMRDREAREPMRTDTIFRIASQSKAITSTAILILQEEGKLLISDPVATFLPEFEATTVAVPDGAGSYSVEPAKRRITIRDLLTHTSGIGYGHGRAAAEWKAADIQNWYFAHRDEPIRETVRRMAELPAEAHPGERFVYGYSTDILGAIVEVASGLPLDQFFAERIFAPLGMVDTHFYLPPEKADRLAVVYSRGDDATLTRAPNPGFMISQGHYIDGPRRSFSGGAGLLSTAHDYARFLQMLLNGGELDGQRILSPKTVALMTANHLNGIDYRPGQGISLAFRVVQDVGLFGEPSEIGDYAWGGAYHTTYWVSPHDNLVVVFMTQLIPAKGSDLHQKLRTLLYQAQVE